VVAIVVEVAADDFRIPYPRTYPVQGASTLEAARKLAMNVALWTLPPGGIKPAAEKPHKDDSEQQAANDQADAEYVAADEQRLAANESGQ
jgi:hypothetical protein